MSLLHPTYLF